MDIYREIILDHYKNPRNYGHLDHPTHQAQDDNVSCGDRIVMEVKLVANKKGEKVVEDIRFSGEGCAINQASASLLTEYVRGKTVEVIKKITTEEIIHMLGTTLTPARITCAVLPLEVLHKAVLDDYE